MKKILLVALILFSFQVKAFAVVGGAAIAAQNHGSSSSKNGYEAMCSEIESKRYKLLALNNYSNDLTVYDKRTGKILDFRYEPDPRFCEKEGWLCTRQGSEIMWELFPIEGDA